MHIKSIPFELASRLIDWLTVIAVCWDASVYVVQRFGTLAKHGNYLHEYLINQWKRVKTGRILAFDNHNQISIFADRTRKHIQFRLNKSWTKKTLSFIMKVWQFHYIYVNLSLSVFSCFRFFFLFIQINESAMTLSYKQMHTHSIETKKGGKKKKRND